MDLMIAIITLSLLCLFLICFFQFRKRRKDNQTELVLEYVSDDDSFSARNMLGSNRKSSVKN